MLTNEFSTHVLVTRPEHQSAGLCAQLLARGLQPIKYPTIEIQAISNKKTALQNIAQNDFIIFVSVNAALHTKRLLHEQWLNTDSTLIAIGPKTSETLKNLGLKPNITTNKPFSSEQLLKQLPSKLHAKSIVIIKGVGGRVFLLQQLKLRGANVTSIDVYKRILPTKKTLPSNTSIKYITITSQLALENLFILLHEQVNELKRSSTFVVFSQRIAEFAKSMGCQQVLVSPQASDCGLVAAIVKAESC